MSEGAPSAYPISNRRPTHAGRKVFAMFPVKIFSLFEPWKRKRNAGFRPAKRGQLLLQTVIVFIPASASVRVLNAIGPT